MRKYVSKYVRKGGRKEIEDGVLSHLPTAAISS
jgi:hypothetical protein